LPNPQASPVGHQIHTNIYCDGPLCGSKNRYITGVRFKCAVCPDVDFCENCEASPYFGHNRTHPLLKFQTPVRGCSITTMVGDETINGPSPCGACETLPQTAAPAKVTPSQISQIRTIADVKPSEPAAKSLKEKIEIKDLLAAPIPEEKVQVKDLLSEPIAEQMQMDYLRGVSNTKVEVKSTDLQAYFIRDTVPDGSTLIPGQRFVQVWTLRNPGPHAWPVGCSVRYVGGDNMLNVDDSHPSSANDIAKATESNVIRHTVEVGEEMAFRVLMKAPKREGVAISYWRLKAADGTPFGHRLWCHINVVSAAPASSAERSEEVPAQGDRTRASLRLFFEEHEENSSKMKEENAVKFQDLKKVYDATKDRMVQLERAEKTKRLKQMLEDQTRAYQEQLMHMDNKNRDELSRIGGLNLDLAERRKRLGNLAKEAAARSAIVNNTSATAEALVAQVETVPKLEAEASNAEGSAMIFPILEKESPASSTHQDHIPTNSAETENVPAVASPTSAKSVDGSEFFEDAESVSLVEDSDDESSGFLTDEEYDILDASDEELA
jgi:next to BRCA1 gene 1 protein